MEEDTANSNDGLNNLPTTSTGINTSSSSNLVDDVTKVELDFIEDQASNGVNHDKINATDEQVIKALE